MNRTEERTLAKTFLDQVAHAVRRGVAPRSPLWSVRKVEAKSYEGRRYYTDQVRGPQGTLDLELGEVSDSGASLSWIFRFDDKSDSVGYHSMDLAWSSSLPSLVRFASLEIARALKSRLRTELPGGFRHGDQVEVVEVRDLGVRTMCPRAGTVGTVLRGRGDAYVWVRFRFPFVDSDGVEWLPGGSEDGVSLGMDPDVIRKRAN
jgi:hypothetical protein